MSHSRRIKIIFAVIGLFIIVAGYLLWHQQRGQTSNLSPKESPSSLQSTLNTEKYETSTEEYDSYVGVISQNAEGQNVYTSSKYHLSFSYPQGWNVGDNHLGYGTFQLWSSDLKGVQNYIVVGNKIEAVVITMDPRDVGKITDYPKGYATTTEVTVAGETAIRFDVNYQAEGGTFVSYTIPLPNISGKYFVISISGDPSNFSMLDSIVKTLKWVK